MSPGQEMISPTMVSISFLQKCEKTYPAFNSGRTVLKGSSMLDVETRTQVAQAPIDRITLLLKHTRSIKSARGGVTAHCPAHHDTENSLMVWEDDSDHHVGV